MGELGPGPEKMRVKICGIADLKVLESLLKLAAKADSLEVFEKILSLFKNFGVSLLDDTLDEGWHEGIRSRDCETV